MPLPNPGHAAGHLRDTFLNSIEDGQPDLVVAGQLWNCTDIMPRTYCDDLDLPPGSTYAQGARQVRLGW